MRTYIGVRYFTAERRSRFYRNELDATASEWDRAYLQSKFGDHRSTRNDMVWWSSILLLYTVIDAYVDAHMAGFDTEVEDVTRITMQIDPLDNRGAALALHARF